MVTAVAKSPRITSDKFNSLSYAKYLFASVFCCTESLCSAIFWCLIVYLSECQNGCVRSAWQYHSEPAQMTDGICQMRDQFTHDVISYVAPRISCLCSDDDEEEILKVVVVVVVVVAATTIKTRYSLSIKYSLWFRHNREM